nr:4'-phosphopantetheinyl transferase superfamily protein [Blautia sp. LMAG:75]
MQWFFKFWTLKEAYVKKTGTGISIPLTKLTFTFSHIPRARYHWLPGP